ncbi:MAG TPA: hypothetical protein QGG93_08685 [Verrucomicrobiota bacterium]|nr:hypothetical protein [Verrucomicrobiota bacterium]
MKTIIIPVVTFALGVFVGFSFVATGSESDGVVVTSGPVYEGQKKLLDSFVEACIAGDAEGCAKLYTDDTIYMQPELPIEVGREVVFSGYHDYFKTRTNKVIEVIEPIEEVISFGNWVAMRGTGKNVEETPDGVLETKTYKYMILSEKQPNGSWLMKWDIYNYDDDYDDE